jgi:hypothetical protein
MGEVDDFMLPRKVSKHKHKVLVPKPTQVDG